jgi:hypothetical protein
LRSPRTIPDRNLRSFSGGSFRIRNPGCVAIESATALVGQRNYTCKWFPDGRVSLTVNSGRDDSRITYVTFKVNGRVVYGGACDVPSVNLANQRGSRRIQGTATVAVATLAAAAARTTRFVPFTKDQIAKFETQLEYGDSAVLDRMFEDWG